MKLSKCFLIVSSLLAQLYSFKKLIYYEIVIFIRQNKMNTSNRCALKVDENEEDVFRLITQSFNEYEGIYNLFLNSSLDNELF